MVTDMTRTFPPRVAESLNGALHQAFAQHSDLFLLGQDVCDPYGGAFGITRGLSTAHPTRVLSTPISENATMGVASGLAMTGHRVIVEVMFADFLPLAFDQILNFISKTVSMYGVHTPMRVLIRCPVGGRRGYGPTHSQSPQKHFIGIPHLALYELSPLHDIDRTLTELLDRDEPSILFEDKVTYTERCYPGSDDDPLYRREPLDHNWIHLRGPTGTGRAPVVLIASGGGARRAIQAADILRTEDDLDVHVLVPARLYPVEVDPILELITAAHGVWVAEESTPGRHLGHRNRCPHPRCRLGRVGRSGSTDQFGRLRHTGSAPPREGDPAAGRNHHSRDPYRAAEPNGSHARSHSASEHTARHSTAQWAGRDRTEDQQHRRHLHPGALAGRRR